MTEQELRKRVGAWLTYMLYDASLRDREMVSAALGIAEGELRHIAQDIIRSGSFRDEVSG